MSFVRGPASIDSSIESAIATSRPALLDLAELPRVPRAGRRKQGFAVKYIPVGYARNYLWTNDGLYIGIADYTWGRGVYVTTVQEPLSTAIYGRVGVVGQFNPREWRVFDARDPDKIALYTEWLALQPNFDDALLTVHSGYWFHLLRNTFRERFRIDCILFRPDEFDFSQEYTRQTDTWLAVSDWHRNQLRSGYSDRFHDVRVVIVGEEEFVADKPAFNRIPQLHLSGAPSDHSSIARQVIRAYRNRTLVRLES